MQNDITEIKARADIVAVISDRMDLEKRGSRFVGSCPFHEEKTGSFTVFPDKQRFHCFGCGESGDVLDFLQKYHGIPIKAAIRMLKPDFKPSRRRQMPSALRSHKTLCRSVDIWKALYFNNLSESRREKILGYCIDNWQPWHRPEHFRMIYYMRWKRRMDRHPALMKAWEKNVAEYKKKRDIYKMSLVIKSEDDLIEFILYCFKLDLENTAYNQSSLSAESRRQSNFEQSQTA